MRCDGSRWARLGCHTAWLVVVGLLPGALLGACSKSKRDPNSTPPTATVEPPGDGAGGAPAADDSASTAPATTTPGGAVVEAQCKLGGCASELCMNADADAPGFTTCDYKREYDCFKTAHCAPAADGQCDWEKTPELEKCLGRK